MATRKEVHEHFGPRLMEAINLAVMDEINILRAQHGLDARTGQQFLDAIESKYLAINEPLDT